MLKRNMILKRKDKFLVHMCVTKKLPEANDLYFLFVCAHTAQLSL